MWHTPSSTAFKGNLFLQHTFPDSCCPAVPNRRSFVPKPTSNIPFWLVLRNFQQKTRFPKEIPLVTAYCHPHIYIIYHISNIIYQISYIIYHKSNIIYHISYIYIYSVYICIYIYMCVFGYCWQVFLSSPQLQITWKTELLFGTCSSLSNSLFRLCTWRKCTWRRDLHAWCKFLQ